MTARIAVRLVAVLGRHHVRVHAAPGKPVRAQLVERHADFGMWCLLPYVILITLSWAWASSTAAQVLFGIAALVICFPVPFLLHDALVVHRSSTNALVFLFLPVYQLLVIVPLSLGAAWATWRAKWR
jgi:hypothetical protein